MHELGIFNRCIGYVAFVLGMVLSLFKDEADIMSRSFKIVKSIHCTVCFTDTSTEMKLLVICFFHNHVLNYFHLNHLKS